jgi:hypothetical protein
LGGVIVDASGARSAYIFAGAATAIAGLFVLFFLGVASARGRQDGH